MNLKQQHFITEYLRHRDAYMAYCTAYQPQDRTKYESIMSAANRLLNNDEVGGTIRSVLDNVRNEVEQEIRQELKTELLSVQRKRELLAQIATGEISVLQHYRGKNCSHCSQYVQPSISQMLAAIREDNNLADHYPTKPRFTGDKPFTSQKQQHDNEPAPGNNPQQNSTTTENSPFEG